VSGELDQHINTVLEDASGQFRRVELVALHPPVGVAADVRRDRVLVPRGVVQDHLEPLSVVVLQDRAEEERVGMIPKLRREIREPDAAVLVLGVLVRAAGLHQASDAPAENLVARERLGGLDGIVVRGRQGERIGGREMIGLGLEDRPEQLHRLVGAGGVHVLRGQGERGVNPTGPKDHRSIQPPFGVVVPADAHARGAEAVENLGVLRQLLRGCFVGRERLGVPVQGREDRSQRQLEAAIVLVE
jgi:hypothetical protein